MGEDLARLLATALPLMSSPGPATLSAAAVGAAHGMSPGYLAGLVLGTMLVLLAVASGVASLVLALPGAMPVLAAAAAAYILFLAWRIGTAPPLSSRAIGPGGKGTQAPSAAGGLLIALANPKAYAAFGAIFASVVVVDGDPMADAAVKVGVLSCLILAVNGTWMLAGRGLSRIMAQPRLARAINIVFALSLVGSVAAALAAF